MSAGKSLFDLLAQATGVDRVVAPFMVRRLLLRIRVRNPDALTPADIARLQPQLAVELKKYLEGADYDAAMARIDRLAASTG